MKFLALGDFHGKFPVKLKKLAKDVDFIIALGDYADADEIRKIIFKSWINKRWYEVVGLKKAGEIEKKSFDSGLKVLKELNSLKKPIYVVFGNTDFYKSYLKSDSPVIMPGFYEDKIKKLKNLLILDKHKKKIQSIELIGYGGYVDATDYIKHPVDRDKVRQKIRVKRYKQDEKRFNKFLAKGKLTENAFFVFHWVPYGIFDKVLFKKSPMYKKHVGWEPYTKAIKKYQPELVLCGHMHEYQGMKKMGKTLVVNPGAAGHGKGAIIEINDESKRIEKIKFLK